MANIARVFIQVATSNGLTYGWVDERVRLMGAFTRLSVEILTILSEETDMCGDRRPLLTVAVYLAARLRASDAKTRTRRLFDTLIGLSFKQLAC